MTLTELYRRQARHLERMVAQILGSSADSADIAHDAFLRAYVAELGDRTTLSKALLTVTARRLALNALRNATRRATDMVGDVDALGVLSLEDPAAEAERAELRASLDAAMAAMAPQCRKVFVLRKVEGMPHAEIANMLQISPKTVERHLTKAIRLCRERLIADGHVPSGFERSDTA